MALAGSKQLSEKWRQSFMRGLATVMDSDTEEEDERAANTAWIAVDAMSAAARAHLQRTLSEQLGMTLRVIPPEGI